MFHIIVGNIYQLLNGSILLLLHFSQKMSTFDALCKARWVPLTSFGLFIVVLNCGLLLKYSFAITKTRLWQHSADFYNFLMLINARNWPTHALSRVRITRCDFWSFFPMTGLDIFPLVIFQPGYWEKKNRHFGKGLHAIPNESFVINSVEWDLWTRVGYK